MAENETRTEIRADYGYRHEEGVLEVVVELKIDPIPLDEDVDDERARFYAREVVTLALECIAIKARAELEAEREAMILKEEGDSDNGVEA